MFYPDNYNGAWVSCPDVVDFRAYVTTNIYEDKNAYFVEGHFRRVPRPEKRQADGLVLATMEQANHYELVMGTHGRSGEQFDIWQATFSPIGANGYPKPIFNKLTGEIDPEVAKYWKEHYDLSAIMQRDWKTLGPKLAGKLHFFVGESDTWYLDRAVHLLHDFLESTTDPTITARSISECASRTAIPVAAIRRAPPAPQSRSAFFRKSSAHGKDGPQRRGCDELEVLTVL